MYQQKKWFFVINKFLLIAAIIFSSSIFAGQFSITNPKGSGETRKYQLPETITGKVTILKSVGSSNPIPLSPGEVFALEPGESAAIASESDLSPEDIRIIEGTPPAAFQQSEDDIEDIISGVGALGIPDKKEETEAAPVTPMRARPISRLSESELAAASEVGPPVIYGVPDLRSFGDMWHPLALIVITDCIKDAGKYEECQMFLQRNIQGIAFGYEDSSVENISSALREHTKEIPKNVHIYNRNRLLIEGLTPGSTTTTSSAKRMCAQLIAVTELLKKHNGLMNFLIPEYTITKSSRPVSPVGRPKGDSPIKQLKQGWKITPFVRYPGLIINQRSSTPRLALCYCKYGNECCQWIREYFRDAIETGKKHCRGNYIALQKIISESHSAGQKIIIILKRKGTGAYKGYDVADYNVTAIAEKARAHNVRPIIMETRKLMPYLDADEYFHPDFFVDSEDKPACEELIRLIPYKDKSGYLHLYPFGDSNDHPDFGYIEKCCYMAISELAAQENILICCSRSGITDAMGFFGARVYSWEPEDVYKKWCIGGANTIEENVEPVRHLLAQAMPWFTVGCRPSCELGARVFNAWLEADGVSSKMVLSNCEKVISWKDALLKVRSNKAATGAFDLDPTFVKYINTTFFLPFPPLLSEQREIVDRFLENISERYIQAIRNAGPEGEVLWGGDIELIEIANLHNLRITVYQPLATGVRQNPPIGPENGRPINLWLAGGHYENYYPELERHSEDIPRDNNCLFHAVLRAEYNLVHPLPEEYTFTLGAVAALRVQVADRLKDVIEAAGRQGRMDANPIRARFAAIFEARDAEQLAAAIAYLPHGNLRDEALGLLQGDHNRAFIARTIGVSNHDFNYTLTDAPESLKETAKKFAAMFAGMSAQYKQ